MGNTCCGYSMLNRQNVVSNPQELAELQNNITKCIEVDKGKCPREEVQASTAEKPSKEKYEVFEVPTQNNKGDLLFNSGDGFESSNLNSQENGPTNQLVSPANGAPNPSHIPSTNVTANNIPNLPVPEKAKSKEIGEETLPESTNLKLHIDLNLSSEQPQTKPTEKSGGGKSPKRNGIGKKDKKPAKSINLTEMKLSDETNKKLTLLKEKSDKQMASQAQIKSPNSQTLKRSVTISANANGEISNNLESENYEQSEKTKKVEEIKKEFIEDKRKLDKKQSEKEKSLGRKASARNNRNSPGKHNEESITPKNEELENWKQEELKRLGSLSPKKSLLKRAKTIGEELKGDKNTKKKVKFKDLDQKGKKKRK